jgi:hypothetical protein
VGGWREGVDVEMTVVGVGGGDGEKVLGPICFTSQKQFFSYQKLKTKKLV